MEVVGERSRVLGPIEMDPILIETLNTGFSKQIQTASESAKNAINGWYREQTSRHVASLWIKLAEKDPALQQDLEEFGELLAKLAEHEGAYEIKLSEEERKETGKFYESIKEKENEFKKYLRSLSEEKNPAFKKIMDTLHVFPDQLASSWIWDSDLRDSSDLKQFLPTLELAAKELNSPGTAYKRVEEAVAKVNKAEKWFEDLKATIAKVFPEDAPIYKKIVEEMQAFDLGKQELGKIKEEYEKDLNQMATEQALR